MLAIQCPQLPPDGIAKLIPVEMPQVSQRIPVAGFGVASDRPSAASAPAAPDSLHQQCSGPAEDSRLGSESAHSIYSIFGDTANAAPVATVFSDTAVLGFSIDANGLLVQGLNASQLEDNAEAVAAWAASAGKLAQFASCAATATGAPASSCATSFIQAFGRVARPAIHLRLPV